MEIKQRVANILKSLSMLAALGALLFMYAYGTDSNVIRESSDVVLQSIPKSTLFYGGLAVFAILNLLMNLGLKMYREAKGVAENSIFFKSEEKKQRLQLWFTANIASINCLLASVYAYVGFIKIDGESAIEGYLQIPLVGLVFFLISIVGLVLVIYSGKQERS